MRTSSLAVALGAAIATLGFTFLAAAQAAPAADAAPIVPPPPPSSSAPSPEKPAAQEDEGEHAHPTLSVGIDAVLGFRSASAAADPVDAPLAANKTVTSLVFGVLWHPSKHFAIGARMPLVFASFAPGVGDTSAVAAGNLEIAPEYVTHPSRDTRLSLELGIALPIASGDEFRCPTVATQQQGPGGFVQTDCGLGFSGAQRKAGALQGASLSRGLEDSALFARHRIGFIPKIAFVYDKDAVELGAATKLELLQRVNGILVPDNYDKNATETEWVTTLHGFYRVVPRTFDLGLRVWGVGILEEDFRVVVNPPNNRRVQLAVEPALRVHVAPIEITAGFILPISGPAGHDYNYKAVRLMLGAAFLSR